MCTAKAIRSYLRDGKLPDPGTVCDVKGHMFDDPQLADYEDLTKEERLLINAWNRVTRAFKIPPIGLPFLHV